MKYSFDDVADNNSFWLYFISTQFPHAFDEESDTCLCEFMGEEYNLDECDEWINEFTQYYDGVIDENDGYVDNPNSVNFVLNNHRFIIEFHAGDTLYFLDGDEIGCTGPHFILRTLSFQYFTELLKNVEDVRIYLLVLPMLALEEQNIPYIRQIIKSGLVSLNFQNELTDIITEMIILGLL
ncbi:MAG: immunity protein 19 [Ruminococcus sp.]|nr:immunity protein 19 [Ruminococcus sp.]